MKTQGYVSWSPTVAYICFLLPSIGHLFPSAVLGQESIRYEIADSSLFELPHAYTASTILGPYLAHNLNSLLSLEEIVTLRFVPCSDPTPRYTREAQEIRYCQAFVQLVGYELQQKHNFSILQGDVFGILFYLTYHELGHALIHLHELPVTGREEDVADEFAAFLATAQTFSRARGPDHSIYQALTGMVRFFDEFETIAAELSIDPRSDHTPGQERRDRIQCWIQSVLTLHSYGYHEPINLDATPCLREAQRSASAWLRLLDGSLATDRITGEDYAKRYMAALNSILGLPTSGIRDQSNEPAYFPYLINATDVTPAPFTSIESFRLRHLEALSHLESIEKPVASLCAQFGQSLKVLDLWEDLTFVEAEDLAAGSVAGSALFRLMEAYGYGLIDEYRLPITGVSSDAALQLAISFAALLQSQDPSLGRKLISNEVAVLKALYENSCDGRSCSASRKALPDSIYCWAYGIGSHLIDPLDLPEAIRGELLECRDEANLFLNGWASTFEHSSLPWGPPLGQALRDLELSR